MTAIDSEKTMTTLKELNLNENAGAGTKMDILHPGTKAPLLKSDGKTKQTITLIGTDADKFKALKRVQQNKELRKGRKQQETAETKEEKGLDTLVACTIGWDIELFTGKDESLNEFTEDNVRSLYQDNDFISEQVDDFVADRSNFLNVA